MKDDSVLLWNEEGTMANEVSFDTFEFIRKNKGLDSQHYITNHKLIIDGIPKQGQAEKVIVFLKELLLIQLNERVKFKQSPPKRDINGFNPEEIANELLIEFIKEQIELFKEIYETETLTVNTSIPPINWLGTPSQFAYIFTELANKGYIEYPMHAGDINFSGLGKRLSKVFQVSTTPENLVKEFTPKGGSLSLTKRSKFVIPDIKELS